MKNKSDLDKRSIFESYGFCFGGKWILQDEILTKTLEKKFELIEVIYAFFAEKELLYIGITEKFKRRMKWYERGYVEKINVNNKIVPKTDRVSINNFLLKEKLHEINAIDILVYEAETIPHKKTNFEIPITRGLERVLIKNHEPIWNVVNSRHVEYPRIKNEIQKNLL